MKGKRFFSTFLAMALVATSVPMNASAATNLALNKSAVASSYEEESTSAAKAVDGDLSTRWGTSQDKAAGEYIEVDLGSEQQISEIVIRFERSDESQNILGYHVDFDGETVYTKSTKASQVEKIKLSETKTAAKVRVTIDDANAGTINWVNVGINEIEIYAEAAGLSLNEVVSAVEAIENTVIETDTLVLPEVPEGYKIELNGVDFEQIVRDDLSINRPLIDKEVQISYKVTNIENEESVITDDIAYLVKGEYVQEEGKNEKPAVRPQRLFGQHSADQGHGLYAGHSRYAARRQ